ncbi:MAG: TRAP transporter substrate-binding protein [Flavobacteriaceae bacterium]
MSFHARILGTAAAAAAVTFMSFAANAADITLRYSNWLPAGYHLTEGVMKPWMEDVARVTEGRVKVEMLPKVVGTVNGQYDVAADGLADVVLFPVAYAPGRFPVEDGLELPFVGTDPLKRSVATWDIYKKYMEPLGVFKEVHVVSIFSSNSTHPMTTSKPVKSIDDFKGLKLRSPSPAVTQEVELLGGVAVSKPISELYELLSGGIVDGAIIPLDTVKGFKLDGALKHITVIPGGMSNNMVMIAMNKAVWDKISEKDRKAIDEVSGAFMAKRNGEVIKKKLEESYDVLKAAGITIEDASPELANALKEKLKPVVEDWYKRAKAAGLQNPEAFLKELSDASGGIY